MRCAKCGCKAIKAVPMKNIDDIEGYCYYCKGCHRCFWKSMDETIIDSKKEDIILGVDPSKGETQTCNHDISIDLFSFGIDTAIEYGNKIANGIADYLMDSGYNVSIDNNDDHHASLIIDLSATKDKNKED